MAIAQAHAHRCARLYRRLAPQLRRILQANLRAPAWVVDDACQVAWMALLSAPAPVAEPQVLSWLATTARREALVMLRREAIEVPVADAAPAAADGGGIDPARVSEFWECLGQIRRLPPRQQRMVWMRGLGFRYDEIASATGDSLRTVQRQMTVARGRLDSVA